MNRKERRAARKSGGLGSGGSAGAPSTASFNATHVGKTLWVNGRPVTAARLNPSPTYATIVPDRSAKHFFEYVISFYQTYASIFNYPKSNKMIGQLDGAGGQGCTNVLYGYGKKIIWNAGRTNNVITEYKVPGNKVLKTLPLDYSVTSSCAMNTSGDLAVGILAGSGRGDIVVFKGASGSGTVMTTSLTEEYFDGYDNQGNLFFDGSNAQPGANGQFEYAELPNGSGTAQSITLTGGSVSFPGNIQWDGREMTVGDQSNAVIYQTSGSKIIGSTPLTGSSDVVQFFIKGRTVVGPDAGNDTVEFFRYPAGGKAFR